MCVYVLAYVQMDIRSCDSACAYLCLLIYIGLSVRVFMKAAKVETANNRLTQHSPVGHKKPDVMLA